MFSFVRLLVAFLAFTTLVCCSPARHGKVVKGLGLPISNPTAQNIIAGKYIVVYNTTATGKSEEKVYVPALLVQILIFYLKSTIYEIDIYEPINLPNSKPIL
jgi:hypothetical protein